MRIALFIHMLLGRPFYYRSVLIVTLVFRGFLLRPPLGWPWRKEPTSDKLVILWTDEFHFAPLGNHDKLLVKLAFTGEFGIIRNQGFFGDAGIRPQYEIKLG